MKSFFAKSLAVFGLLQSACGLAINHAATNVDVDKRASGNINAVYFTNWYYLLFHQLFLSVGEFCSQVRDTD